MIEDPVDAEDIGRDFVPRFREQVSAIPVADEAVLYEEDNGRLHQLNPTAVAVSSLIDGRTPLATMIGELASRFDVDAGRLEEDVVEMVRDLARKGLLKGVRDDEADVEVRG